MQTRVNLLQNLHSNLRLTRAKVLLRIRKECVCLADRECRKISNTLATDRYRKCLGLQTRAVTRRTRRIRHVVFVALAHLLRVRLAIAARKCGQNALVRNVVFLFLAEHIRVMEGNIFLRTVEQHLLCLLVHALPRRMLVIIMRTEERRDRAHPIGVRILRKRRKDTVRHTECRVGQNEFGVEFLVTAEPRTDGTRAERTVE